MRKHGLILKEGYPFVVPPVGLAVLGYLGGYPLLAAAALAVAFASAMFFRNPRRSPPIVDAAAISPADGRVVEISEGEPDPFSGDPSIRLSVFMSILDVHVNRAPVTGHIERIQHFPGGYMVASRAGASRSNERNMICIRTAGGATVSCVQVAGAIARRIVCWVKEGDRVAAGEPIGMIRFGSRVDCYFPSGFTPGVSINQRVRAGRTILGYLS